MHGIIISEFRRYVIVHAGPESRVLRHDLVRDDGGGQLVGERASAPALVTLAEAVAHELDRSVQSILQEFGRFLAPTLLRIYRAMIRPGWTTLDVLQHAEVAMHRAVRLRHEQADPPRLAVVRATPDRVVIRYSSHRRLCSLGMGLIQGIATQFGEVVVVGEPRCMHAGADACIITVERPAPSAGQGATASVAWSKDTTPAGSK